MDLVFFCARKFPFSSFGFSLGREERRGEERRGEERRGEERRGEERRGEERSCVPPRWWELPTLFPWFKFNLRVVGVC